MTLINFANPALGAVASATGSVTGYPAGQAIDQTDVTEWRSSGAAQLTVDLGAPQYVTNIHVHSLTAYDWTVRYSTDNSTWNIVGTIANSLNGADLATGGISAQYWRIDDIHNNRVASFEIWGPAEAPPPPTYPPCDYISAWLDGIEANYVPCVEDWLEANP